LQSLDGAAAVAPPPPVARVVMEGGAGRVAATSLPGLPQVAVPGAAVPPVSGVPHARTIRVRAGSRCGRHVGGHPLAQHLRASPRAGIGVLHRLDGAGAVAPAPAVTVVVMEDITEGIRAAL